MLIRYLKTFNFLCCGNCLKFAVQLPGRAAAEWHFRISPDYDAAPNSLAVTKMLTTFSVSHSCRLFFFFPQAGLSHTRVVLQCCFFCSGIQEIFVIWLFGSGSTAL